MISARTCFAVAVALAIMAIFTTFVQAKEVSIPSFPDQLPSSIVPVPPGNGRSYNISAAPTLTGGMTSPDGTVNCLQMEWASASPHEEARAGWRYLFGQDPDLTNHWMGMSVHPPGAWIPDPQNPLGPFVFSGVKQIEVCIADVNGLIITGWGFNTDQAGTIPLWNGGLGDGIGGTSVRNNFMTTTVNISIGNGAVAGSAWVTDPLNPGVYIAPNYIVPKTSPLTVVNAFSLDYYEDAIFRGSYVVPGTGVQVNGDCNWWDHINVTSVPEPGAWAMLVCGALAALICGGWRRLFGS